MPTPLLVGFAIIGALSLIAVAGVAYVWTHPEPPVHYGDDSKLN